MAIGRVLNSILNLSGSQEWYDLFSLTSFSIVTSSSVATLPLPYKWEAEMFLVFLQQVAPSNDLWVDVKFTEGVKANSEPSPCKELMSHWNYFENVIILCHYVITVIFQNICFAFIRTWPESRGKERCGRIRQWPQVGLEPGSPAPQPGVIAHQTTAPQKYNF